MLETERLILRRWEEGDAEDLYKLASNPDVGPIAGWPAHKNIEESRCVIRNVLNGKEAYAVCLKEDGKAIGAIEHHLACWWGLRFRFSRYTPSKGIINIFIWG